jgi:hypothetical protein
VCKREKKERKREKAREEEKHNTHIILYTHTHPNTCKEERVNNNHAKSAQM